MNTPSILRTVSSIMVGALLFAPAAWGHPGQSTSAATSRTAHPASATAHATAPKPTPPTGQTGAQTAVGGTATSITQDVTVNKARTADKAYKMMDEYIRQ